MDTSKEQITALVFRAVDEINLDLPPTAQMAKNPNTVLFGSGATIDSMTLVSFIVAVEEQLLDAHGISVTLATDKAMSMERSPFKTLDTMVEYVCEVVESAGDE